MVGSAAIKQGRSANRKHTYFFFGLGRESRAGHYVRGNRKLSDFTMSVRNSMFLP